MNLVDVIYIILAGTTQLTELAMVKAANLEQVRGSLYLLSQHHFANT